MRSPYPRAPRAYWKGYSRKQDEKLASELFYGTFATNKQSGRDHHHYPLAGSPHECRALEALRRLLFYGCKDLEPTIFAALCCSLDPNSGFERRLVFKARKKGRRHDFAADSQIDVHVLWRRAVGWPAEAAVSVRPKTF